MRVLCFLLFFFASIHLSAAEVEKPQTPGSIRFNKYTDTTGFLKEAMIMGQTAGKKGDKKGMKDALCFFINTQESFLYEYRNTIRKAIPEDVRKTLGKYMVLLDGVPNNSDDDNSGGDDNGFPLDAYRLNATNQIFYVFLNGDRPRGPEDDYQKWLMEKCKSEDQAEKVRSREFMVGYLDGVGPIPLTLDMLVDGGTPSPQGVTYERVLDSTYKTCQLYALFLRHLDLEQLKEAGTKFKTLWGESISKENISQRAIITYTSKATEQANLYRQVGFEEAMREGETGLERKAPHKKGAEHLEKIRKKFEAERLKGVQDQADKKHRSLCLDWTPRGKDLKGCFYVYDGSDEYRELAQEVAVHGDHMFIPTVSKDSNPDITEIPLFDSNTPKDLIPDGLREMAEGLKNLTAQMSEIKTSFESIQGKGLKLPLGFEMPGLGLTDFDMAHYLIWKWQMECEMFKMAVANIKTTQEMVENRLKNMNSGGGATDTKVAADPQPDAKKGGKKKKNNKKKKNEAKSSEPKAPVAAPVEKIEPRPIPVIEVEKSPLDLALGQLAEEKARNAALVAENEKLKGKLDRAREKSESRKEELESCRKKLEELERVDSRRFKRLSIALESNKDLSQELSEMKDENMQLQRNVKTSRINAAKALRQVHSQRNLLAEKIEENGNLEIQLRQKNMELEKKNAELARMHREMQEKSQLIESINAESLIKESALQSLRDDLGRLLDKKKLQNDEAVRKSIEAKELAIKSLSASCESLKLRQKNTEKDFRSLVTAFNALYDSTENYKLARRLEEALGKIAQLEGLVAQERHQHAWAMNQVTKELNALKDAAKAA